MAQLEAGLTPRTTADQELLYTIFGMDATTQGLLYSRGHFFDTVTLQKTQDLDILPPTIFLLELHTTLQDPKHPGRTNPSKGRAKARECGFRSNKGK